jgi:programmed cell death protein 4
LIPQHRKGQWDALDGADMDDIPDALDENDPNYDDFAESGKYILSSTDGAQSTGAELRVDDRIVYGPMLTKSEFKIRVGDIVKEYFDSGDADEVIRSIDELKCQKYHEEVVKKAISLSLDEGPRERELVSRLLTCLHPYPLEDEQMTAGFDILLDSLEDLSIDIPDAKTIVGCFLARAIVDEGKIYFVFKVSYVE